MTLKGLGLDPVVGSSLVTSTAAATDRSVGFASTYGGLPGRDPNHRQGYLISLLCCGCDF